MIMYSIGGDKNLMIVCYISTRYLGVNGERGVIISQGEKNQPCSRPPPRPENLGGILIVERPGLGKGLTLKRLLR